MRANSSALSTTIGRAVRSTLRIDSSALSLRSGGFATLGVIVPLTTGFLFHQVLVGAVAAIGALLVGFAGFQRGYRGRIVTMLLAAVAVAVSLVVGDTIHTQLPTSVIAYLVLGLLAGGALAFGESASTIGIQAIVAFAIGSGLGVPSSQWLSLMLAGSLGGILQILLTTIAILTSRAPMECRALGQVYASLGRYAESPLLDRAPNPHLISVLQDSLVDPQPFRARRTASLLELTVSAENLRSQLAMLRVTQTQPGASQLTAPATNNMMGLTNAVCQQVVAFARGHHHVARWRSLKQEVEQTQGLLAEQPHARVLLQLLSDLTAIMNILLGLETNQLRRPARTRQSFNPFDRAFSTSSKSVVSRHAIRLAIALVASDIAVHLLGVGHGYWGPMTVALVLRPQNVSTIERGLLRIAGTVLGVGIATVIIIALTPPVAAMIVLVAIVTWAGFASFRANYFFYSISITAVVVALFVLLGATATTIAVDRLIDTLVGGVIAVIIAFVAPTWISDPLPALVGSTLLAQASFMEFLGTHWAKNEVHGYMLLETARRKRVLAIETLNAAAHEAPLRKNPRDTTRERELLVQLDRSSLALLAIQSLSALGVPIGPERIRELVQLADEIRNQASSTASCPPVQNSSTHPVGSHETQQILSPLDLPFEVLRDACKNIQVLLAY
ncbi:MULTISPECIES: FUSC family protein [Ferrimicrobium]|uniref:FUSC family protein n=1 Tax=Ferrimicrobium acidiphilum TaxID=121039 RepID=A0ABV3Y319_9ACTN|nr:FUSC family protein [Ferrimicrobium sp.]MCL5052742.1 FUSC family protein [Gammaproteobacteria bacterium]